ncbi:MAG: GIY-YIG nuclease family protein [Patescibacteria group bacterium]|jgi:excinuclease ABC subunit C
MTLLEKAKKLPLSPGVYQWLDDKGKILYIGRATSLRRRVLQYFQKDIDPRIGEMVTLAKTIKHIKTDTVLEAIILEANLIKKHWPKYNVKDKDNRSFIYIAIPKTDYPHPIVVRGRELEKFPTSTNRIFGPYQSATLIRNALRIIRKIIPYSTCRLNQGKPCFDRQIGLCPGICTGEISKVDYQKNIKNIILLLSGQKKRLLQKMKKENPEQAKNLQYIQDVTLISRDELQGVEKKQRIEAYDISHFAGKETIGAMTVFTDGLPDNSQYRLFNIKSAPESDDLKALEEMVIRRLRHSEWQMPDLILIDGGKPQVDHIHKILSKAQVTIPMLGLSKYQNDKLVFPAKTKESIKNLAQSIKPILLQARDEAHRFSNRARKNKMRIRL